MSFLVIRPCLENVWSVSGDGIVMGFQSSKKYKRSCDLNQTKKSRNQQAESRDLSMNVITIPEILQPSGAGISIISVDGSIWRARTARWIKTIWSQSCGFSSKSGRNDTSTKGSVSHGIPGNFQLRFQTLKSRWMIVTRMSRIQQLR
jgi:hypothetical protein